MDSIDGPVIRTRFGRYVNLQEPDPATITIEDIAFALSHVNRFTGHVGTYSVGMHSLLVAGGAVHLSKDTNFILHALLHDAAEGYLGDVAAPLKRLLPDYKAMETKMEAIIEKALVMEPASELERKTIKYMDMAALAVEKDHFFGSDIERWKTIDDFNLLDRFDEEFFTAMRRGVLEFSKYSSAQTEKNFLELYTALRGGWSQ